MLLLARSVSTFNFDLDSAWIELKTLWDLVKYWSFSFTTYNLSISNGVISSTPQTNTIYILDFLAALMVWTTLNDVLFWWKKSENGELDED